MDGADHLQIAHPFKAVTAVVEREVEGASTLNLDTSLDTSLDTLDTSTARAQGGTSKNIYTKVPDETRKNVFHGHGGGYVVTYRLPFV